MPTPRLGQNIFLKKFLNKEFLFIKQEAIELLTEKAFSDISHLYRESHLKQLEKILLCDVQI